MSRRASGPWRARSRRKWLGVGPAVPVARKPEFIGVPAPWARRRSGGEGNRKGHVSRSARRGQWLPRDLCPGEGGGTRRRAGTLAAARSSDPRREASQGPRGVPRSRLGPCAALVAGRSYRHARAPAVRVWPPPAVLGLRALRATAVRARPAIHGPLVRAPVRPRLSVRVPIAIPASPPSVPDPHPRAHRAWRVGAC